MEYFTKAKQWVMDRTSERTTLDGCMLIAAGVCFLFLNSIATMAAYAAIAYGAWTLFKSEK